MNIAEKLTTIAENQQKVFAAGKVEAEAANAEILTDCNAVLPDKGVQTAETLEQVPQRIGEIESPKWLPYITNWTYMFAWADFPENTELIVDMDNLCSGVTGYTHNSLAFMCSKSKNLTTAKIISTRETTGIPADYIFNECHTIRTIDFSECKRPFNSFTYGVTSCFVLEEIIGELSFASNCSTQLAFYNDSELREVRFVKGTIHKSIDFPHSPKLSDSSIQSIIDGLADLTGQTAQTLKFHKTVGNKLTDAQKATITAKNWTLVY